MNLDLIQSASLLAVTNTQLVLVSVIGVALILFLIIVMKLHAFVTLLLVSFIVGIAAGMPILSSSETKVVLKGFEIGNGKGRKSDDKIASHFESVYKVKKGDKKGQLTGPYVFDLPKPQQIMAYGLLEVTDSYIVIDADSAAGEDKVDKVRIDYNQITNSTSFKDIEVDQEISRGDKGRNAKIKDHFKNLKAAGSTESFSIVYYELEPLKAEHIHEVHKDHVIVDADMDPERVEKKKITYKSIESVSTLNSFKKKGVIDTVNDGMGGILGFVAIIVGLGAMFGKMLEVSGGAERIAKSILNKFGDDKAPWALGLTGFLISIPVFLDVGLIIIIPIVYSLAQRTGKPILFYGIPLLAGLGVTHSMIPPTPGPIAVADLLGADLGWVILFGTIAGIPAMIIAGPMFGKYISKKVVVGIPDFVDFKEPEEGKPLPSFGLVILLILTPLVLILLSTLMDRDFVQLDSSIETTVKFLGHPFVAMLIATIMAFYTLGKFCGYTRDEVQDIATKALEPAGIIILVTGAGGVFKQVLIDSGVGQMLGALLKDSAMPPVVLAFIIATLVRVAQGSATVAMVTGGGIMAGIMAGAGMAPSAPLLGLIAISVACGATVFSHVNDSGFWLVNRFFGMSVKDTLKTWTMVETIIGFVGFGVVLILSLFIK